MLIDRRTWRVNRRPQQGIRPRCIGTSTTSDARRPVSASIGQGRSHGSRGQVDKSPFLARRSVAEKKEGTESAREGGGIGGGEAQQRRRSGLFSPPIRGRRWVRRRRNDLGKSFAFNDLIFDRSKTRNLLKRA